MNKRLAIVCCVGLTVLWWGSSPVGIRLSLHSYSPEHVALLRFIVASVAMLAFAGLVHVRLPRWRDMPLLFLLGLFAIALHHLALNFGQKGVTAAASSFLAQSSPLFTVFVARFVLRERLDWRGWAGICAGSLGAALIMRGEGGGHWFNIYALLVLLSALSWSFYFVLQKPVLSRYTSFQLTCYTVWMGSLPLLVFVPGLWHEIQGASPAATGAIVYLGLFPSALAYMTWSSVLRAMPVSRAVPFLFLAPPVALALGWVVLGEFPSSLSLAGGLITIGGVAFVNVKRRRACQKRSRSDQSTGSVMGSRLVLQQSHEAHNEKRICRRTH